MICLDVGQGHDREAAELAAIRRSCCEDDWGDSAFAALLGEPTVVRVLARCDATIVGYVLLRVVAGESEVLDCAVREEFRGHGIGQAMLVAVLEAAKDRGSLCTYLEVSIANATAQRLYARLGFHEVGRRRGYYRSRAGAVCDALILRHCR